MDPPGPVSRSPGRPKVTLAIWHVAVASARIAGFALPMRLPRATRAISVDHSLRTVGAGNSRAPMARFFTPEKMRHRRARIVFLHRSKRMVEEDNSRALMAHLRPVLLINRRRTDGDILTECRVVGAYDEYIGSPRHAFARRAPTSEGSEVTPVRGPAKI